jgi:hypothetical protein
MTFGLSDRGEEIVTESGLVGTDVEVTVYLDDSDIDNDGSPEGDELLDGDGLGAVTTEPNISRKAHSIVSSDVGQFNGDFGVTFSETLNTSGLDDEVDGVLLIEQGTSNIVARSQIVNPEPGPYQSLTGLTSLTVEPEVTFD